MLREPELYVAADMAIREELRQINVVSLVKYKNGWDLSGSFVTSSRPFLSSANRKRYHRLRPASRIANEQKQSGTQNE